MVLDDVHIKRTYQYLLLWPVHHDFHQKQHHLEYLKNKYFQGIILQTLTPGQTLIKK